MRSIGAVMVLAGAIAGCDDMEDFDVHVNGDNIVIRGNGINQRIEATKSVASAPTTPLQFSGFDAVSTETSVDVTASHGSAHSASLACDPARVNRLDIVMDGSVLVVRSKGSGVSISTNGGCRLIVQAPRWRAFASTASGDVVATGPLDALEHAHTSGSGDLTISGIQSSGALNVSIGGSGDIRLQGTADHLTAIGQGSGDLIARNLEVRAAEVRAQGSGDIRVNATDTVNATTLGSGDVSVEGGASVTGQTLGSGDIHK